MSVVYLERWKVGEHANKDALLRSAHFAQEGLSSSGCHPDPIARCADLNAMYAQSVSLLVSEQPEGVPLSDLYTNRYRIELNGDRASIDLHEWSLVVPKTTQPLADAPGVRAGHGVPMTACQIAPQPQGSYAECLPATLVLTFEGTTDAQFNRGFLTALDPSENEFVRAGDTQLTLAARAGDPFLVASERSREPRLTCVGPPDPKRPTIVSLQNSPLSSRNVALAESLLSQDTAIGPVFNYCSFPVRGEGETEGDVDTLVSLLASHISSRNTLFEKPKKADVVLISADSVSARVAGALRDRLRTSSSSRSNGIPEQPFTIAGALALSESQSFPPIDSRSSLEESLGMRDMRRTLERIAENYPREDQSLSGNDGIDLAVSPVM